jgi:ribonuclease HI
MEWLAQNWEIDFIKIMNDNKNVIEQLMGKNQCHSIDLQPRLKACRELEVYFVHVDYVWIPREENKVADAISKCLQSKHGGKKLTREEVLSLIADTLLDSKFITMPVKN